MATKKSTTKTKNKKLQKKLKQTNSKLEETPTNVDVKTGKNPDVIVDFEYDDGLLFIIIENIGDEPAYETLIKFNKRIFGIQKTRNISSLKIFQSLKFLPAGKKIKILVDLFQSYVVSKQPMEINMVISFRNKSKQTFKNSIQHDLSIYKDFVEIYRDKKNI